jgi:hypothetical protein
MSDSVIPMIEESTVAELQAGLRGELIRPGGEGYEEARLVWNGLIDKRPGLIARCRDVLGSLQQEPYGRKARLCPDLAVQSGVDLPMAPPADELGRTRWRNPLDGAAVVHGERRLGPRREVARLAARRGRQKE